MLGSSVLLLIYSPYQMSSLSVVFDSVEAYAPGFKASIIGIDVLTPPDLEQIFGLPGGVCTS